MKKTNYQTLWDTFWDIQVQEGQPIGADIIPRDSFREAIAYDR